MIRLRHEQLVHVEPDPLRVRGVHGVLGVDERADAALLLGLGQEVVEKGRLARRLRAEPLDDPPTRHPAHAQRDVERQRARRDRVDAHGRVLVAHAHDRSLPELALDLGERAVQRGVAGLRGLFLFLVHKAVAPRSWKRQAKDPIGRNSPPKTRPLSAKTDDSVPIRRSPLRTHKEGTVSKVRFQIAISLDGFSAGPNQSEENPLGEGGEQLHEWALELEAWRRPHGYEGGEGKAWSAVSEEASETVAAIIMGRNMFGGGPGPWDSGWEGWWGDEPPFHVPV